MRMTTLTPLTAVAYNNEGSGLLTPTGRIVWGHPLKPRQKIDNETKQKVLDQQGQPVMETSYGLAIPIAEFQQHVWPMMQSEALKGYPNGAPGNFSWKMTQPTDIDNKGQPYSLREGYADHVVIAVSTLLEPPPAFRWDAGRNQWVQMQPDEIKCGDYIRADLNFKVNVSTSATRKPSLYVNPRAVQFVGYGAAIVSAGYNVDPNATFGAGPAPLPPGASAVPVGGAPESVGMPGAPVAGMPGAAPAAGMPGNAPLQPATMPGAPSALPVAAVSPPLAPSAPARPTDPTHVHDNGNGTEQWFINGAWDGGAHPVVPTTAPATLPPPATGFVAQAAGMPGAMPPR